MGVGSGDEPFFNAWQLGAEVELRPFRTAPPCGKGSQRVRLWIIIEKGEAQNMRCNRWSCQGRKRGEARQKLEGRRRRLSGSGSSAHFLDEAEGLYEFAAVHIASYQMDTGDMPQGSLCRITRRLVTVNRRA